MKFQQQFDGDNIDYELADSEVVMSLSEELLMFFILFNIPRRAMEFLLKIRLEM